MSASVQSRSVGTICGGVFVFVLVSVHKVPQVHLVESDGVTNPNPSS